MSKKTNYDYQLDLTPFISLLSVCICFLLVTVAWYQVGSLSMKQVLGGDTSGASDEHQPSLWIHLESEQHMLVKIKKNKKYISKKKIYASHLKSTKDTHFNYKGLKKYVVVIKKQVPNLNQAFILPKSDIRYEELIKVMDYIRQAGIFNLGVSPI